MFEKINRNMQEKLISFETAKLAKEKEFGIQSDKYWCNYYSGEPVNKWKLLSSDKLSLNWMEFPAPTQSLLQKWLRETHKIYVLVDMGITRNYHWKYFTDIDSFVYPKGSFKTYEGALEAGLQEALKLIEIVKKQTT
jgi:hypothetical protein